MQVILNSLIPIFAVIGLGVALRRKDFVDQAATQSFNRFAYYWGLPLYTLALLLATIVAMLSGWLVATVARIKFASRGALVQASLRGNLAFMGLPLVAFLIADLDLAKRQPIEAAMLISLAPVIIFYNVASVAMLAIYNEDSESNFSWGGVLRNIVFNPILLACLAGWLAQRLQWQVPQVVERTCQIIGAAAFPMALIGIGSQLAQISPKGQLRLPLISTAIKCVVLAAMPTAVSSYVLAEQMNSDADLAASSVVISTALSMLTLTVLLLIL